MDKIVHQVHIFHCFVHDLHLHCTLRYYQVKQEKAIFDQPTPFPFTNKEKGGSSLCLIDFELLATVI